MLLEVARTSIVSTQRKIGILFQAWTTYKWMDNHWILSILVTSLVEMQM
jgi:hypothetical protein